MGAYQEILGDLHNLFGDTNAVHVSLGDNGEVMLDAVIRGDTVREVLDYVQFNSQDAAGAVPQGCRVGVARGQNRVRGIRQTAAVLRGRLERLHVPGRRHRALENVGVQVRRFRMLGFLPGILGFDRTGRFYGSDPLAGEFPYLLLLIELWFLRHTKCA